MHLEGAIVDNKLVKNMTEWYLPFLSESVSEDLKPKFGEYPIVFETDYKKIQLMVILLTLNTL